MLSSVTGLIGDSGYQAAVVTIERTTLYSQRSQPFRVLPGLRSMLRVRDCAHEPGRIIIFKYAYNFLELAVSMDRLRS